jgi:hypothetical protein
MVEVCGPGRIAEAAAAGAVVIRRTYMFELLGAVIGCLLGLIGPFIYAQIYVAREGDPTAAGALFIVTFVTAPTGIVIGAVFGFAMRLKIKRSNS